MRYAQAHQQCLDEADHALIIEADPSLRSGRQISRPFASLRATNQQTLRFAQGDKSADPSLRSGRQLWMDARALPPYVGDPEISPGSQTSRHMRLFVRTLVTTSILAASLSAQGTPADYRRADSLA